MRRVFLRTRFSAAAASTALNGPTSRFSAQRCSSAASWSRSSRVKPVSMRWPTVAADVRRALELAAALVGEDDQAAAPVVGVGLALDQAALADGVDEGGEGRRRDVQPTGQAGLVGGGARAGEAGEQLPLLHGEPVLAGDAIARLLHEPVHAAQRLDDARPRGCVRGRHGGSDLSNTHLS